MVGGNVLEISLWMVADWGNGGVVEWWLVTRGDGMVVWRLHQILSVRIVFSGTCDDSKLEVRGGTRGPPSSL